jgi:hypothetical protein
MILLREASRVARKNIVIKDHILDGLVAGPALRFTDVTLYGSDRQCASWCSADLQLLATTEMVGNFRNFGLRHRLMEFKTGTLSQAFEMAFREVTSFRCST